MANVLNRTTKQFLPSVNTPDYPVAEWIRNPDMTAVDGLPPKYWKITGDVVTAMDAGEQAAVDAADASALDTSQMAAAKAEFDAERVLRAVVAAVLDEINTLRTALSLAPRTAAQVRTAIRSKIDGGV